METKGKNESYKVFAYNLAYQMKRNKIDRVMLSKNLGIKYTTFCEWYNGNVMPKLDKVQKIADYFGINVSDLLNKPNDNVTDADISKKREILVYKDFPSTLKFNEEIEKKYLWESVELPTTYGDPNNYFGYMVFDDIKNYGKSLHSGDTIVFKKINSISRSDTFYLVQANKGKPFVAYVINSGDYYTLMPVITYVKENSKPLTFSKNSLDIKIIGVAQYSITNL